MAEENKDTIVIAPRIATIAKFIRKKKDELKRSPYVLVFAFIFLGFLLLLVLITYLPISKDLKILGLLIGSFILEDVLHSFKKIWTRQN